MARRQDFANECSKVLHCPECAPLYLSSAADLVVRKKVDSLPCSGTSARAHLCRAGRLGEVWAADNTVLAGWGEAAGSLDRFCATTMTLGCVGEQAIVASLWTEKHAYSAQKQSILKLLKCSGGQHSIREAAGVSPSACY